MTSNFSAQSHFKQMKHVQSNHNQIADCLRNVGAVYYSGIWGSREEATLVIRTTAKKYANIDGAVNACGKNGYSMKKIWLLFHKRKRDEGNYTVKMSAATTNQISEVTSFRNRDPLSKQGDGNMLSTYILPISGSMVSTNDQSVHKN